MPKNSSLFIENTPYSFNDFVSQLTSTRGRGVLAKCCDENGVILKVFADKQVVTLLEHIWLLLVNQHKTVCYDKGTLMSTTPWLMKP